MYTWNNQKKEDLRKYIEKNNEDKKSLKQKWETWDKKCKEIDAYIGGSIVNHEIYQPSKIQRETN